MFLTLIIVLKQQNIYKNTAEQSLKFVLDLEFIKILKKTIFPLF